jgi:hypothetical protein
MESAHDSKSWSLFENRPAKERTSSLAIEQAPEQRRHDEADGWSRLRRTLRTTGRAEHVKC